MAAVWLCRSKTYVSKGGPFHRSEGAISPSKGGHLTVLEGGHFTVDNSLNPQLLVEKWRLTKGGHFTVPDGSVARTGLVGTVRRDKGGHFTVQGNSLRAVIGTDGRLG